MISNGQSVKTGKRLIRPHNATSAEPEPRSTIKLVPPPRSPVIEIAYQPGSSGYVPDSERVQKVDPAKVIRAEKEEKQRKRERMLQRKREVLLEAERARAEKLLCQNDRSEKKIEDRKPKLRSKNSPSVSYNVITLKYHDDPHGIQLRQRDEEIRFRAEMRKYNLHKRSGTYNPITGEDVQIVPPTPPDPNSSAKKEQPNYLTGYSPLEI